MRHDISDIETYSLPAFLSVKYIVSCGNLNVNIKKQKRGCMQLFFAFFLISNFHYAPLAAELNALEQNNFGFFIEQRIKKFLCVTQRA